MTGRTHDLAAITALGGVVYFAPIHTVTLATALIALLANQMGGIAPDIDQPTAPLWRDLPIGSLFGRVVDTTFGGHRFITHSIVGLALFGFLLHLVLVFIHPIIPTVNSGYVWWAFMIGMLSHLVMDTLTKEGVPWLLPLPFKFGFPPVKSLRITTGKAIETWVVFPGLLVLDIVFCATHYGLILQFIHHHLV
ncbi:MAG TPA: metal-dependent hydrolase [Candidatus Saccharimonadia bacterium]|jgi:inner membrane protein|nr:metal-dependent hydrolase [Candidatus Saccharimonadia bacterium]